VGVSSFVGMQVPASGQLLLNINWDPYKQDLRSAGAQRRTCLHKGQILSIDERGFETSTSAPSFPNYLMNRSNKGQ
jgi:hypothetical protein